MPDMMRFEISERPSSFACALRAVKRAQFGDGGHRRCPLPDVAISYRN